MTDKTQFFFELLKGQYGIAKMQSAWPTDHDLQLAKEVWRPEIEKHTEQELSGALQNARRMMASGDDEWMWPNIGLILSGARHSARAYLPAKEETREEREAKRIWRIEQLKKLREATGL